MDPYNNLPTQNYHLYQKYCNIQGQQQLPPPPPQQQQQDYYYHQQPPQLPYYPSLSNHHRPFSRHRFDTPILPEPVLRDTLLRDSRRDDVFFSDDVFGQSSGQSRNRRGVRLFNGGRNFDSRGSPPFHDREYNGGRYKGSMFNDSASGLPNVASSSESGVAKMSQVPAAKVKPSTRQPWCELCRIFCSSAKTMEDHKNGKRHKANLIEEGKSHKQKVKIGQQNSSQRSDFEYKADTRQSGKVDKYKEMQTQMENIQPEKVIAAPERGKKRPRTGDQGCKFMRSNDGARRPVNLKKPTCKLCNVTCGSEVDFQSHLNGKKHFLNLELSREKQDASGSSSSNAPSMKKHFVKPELFRDNKDALGSVSVNALSMSSKSQVQQQENTLIILSQTSVHSQSQALEKPGAALVADLVPTPPQVPHLEIQQCQQSLIHGSESNIEVGGAVSVSENFETKQQSITVMSEGPPSSSNEQDFPATEPDTSLPTGGCEFVSSNHGVKLNAKSNLEEQMSEDDSGEYLEDPEEDPEENPEEDPEEDPEEATNKEDPEEDPEEATIEEDPEEDPEEATNKEDPEEDPEEATIEEDPEEDPEEAKIEEDPEEDPEETILEEDPEEDPEETILEEDPEEDPEETYLEEDPEENPEETYLEEDPEEYPEEDSKEAVLEDEEDPEEDPEEMIPEDEDPEEYEEEDPDEDPTEEQ